MKNIITLSLGRQFCRIRTPLFILSMLSGSFFPCKGQNLAGTDFWFSMPVNNGTATYQIILVSDFISTGTLEFPKLGESTPFTVTPGNPAFLTIDPSYHNTLEEEIEDYGFHISCDSPIVAYAINYFAATEDAETLLPLTMMDTFYVVTSTSEGPRGGSGASSPASVTIVATEDNTKVTITTTKKTTTGDHKAKSKWSVVMNAGESYMFASNSDFPKHMTLTGSTISSNKPVSVLGNTNCTDFGRIQYGEGCSACDATMNHIVPPKHWGRKYVIAQAVERQKMDPSISATGSMADYVEISAGATGAKINVNRFDGNVNYDIAPYGRLFYENPKGPSPDIGEANVVITSDNPVNVTQFSKSCGCDWQTNPAECLIDPEAISVFPESDWISSYVFCSSPTATSAGAQVIIIIDDAGTPQPTGTLLFDNVPIVGQTWLPIGTSTYKFTRMATTPGLHRISSTAGYRFCFYLYALGFAESYVIQGGGFAKDMQGCPTAFFTASEGCEGKSTQFTASGSSDPTCTIVKWEWDYGDGTKETFTSPTNPSHLYADGGTYNVKLIVTNDCTQPCSDSTIIAVALQPLPHAGFDFQIDSLDVYFKGTAANGVNKWLWDFGDRSPTSTEQNPSHTYLQLETFTVTLYVWSDCGVDSIKFEVTINGSDGGGTTSINPVLFNQEDIKVYPNPFAGEFSMEFSATQSLNFSAKLFDILGKQVPMVVKEGSELYRKEKFILPGIHRFTMQPEQLPNRGGVYFLHVALGNQVFRFRMVNL